MAGTYPRRRVRARGAPSVRVRPARGGTVRLGRAEVLRDVSLTVDHGEYVCVRGANGAGKTTLLRLVAGAICARAGSRGQGPRSCAYVPPALAPPSITVARWMPRRAPRAGRRPVGGARRARLRRHRRSSCRELSFGNLRKVLLADAFTSATRWSRSTRSTSGSTTRAAARSNISYRRRARTGRRWWSRPRTTTRWTAPTTWVIAGRARAEFTTGSARRRAPHAAGPARGGRRAARRGRTTRVPPDDGDDR